MMAGMIQKARHTNKANKAHEAHKPHKPHKANESHEAHKVNTSNTSNTAHKAGKAKKTHKTCEVNKSTVVNKANRVHEIHKSNKDKNRKTAKSFSKRAKQFADLPGSGEGLPQLPHHDVYDIAIIGGGASGLTAAIVAAQEAYRHHRFLKIVVLEQNKRIGTSIMRSGNGRCNFSHVGVEADCYHNADFVQQACDALASADNLPSVLSWFDDLGLVYDELPGSQGMLFPLSRKANSVLDVLRRALDEHHVEVRTHTKVVDLQQVDAMQSVSDAGASYISDATDGNAHAWVHAGIEADTDIVNGEAHADADAGISAPFVLSLHVEEPGTSSGASVQKNRSPESQEGSTCNAENASSTCTIRARVVVLAAGGGCAEAITTTLRPALPLVPCTPVLGSLALRVPPTLAWQRLNGIRMTARVTVPQRGFSEVGEVLFRDYGISGIVVFNASRFACSGDTLLLDLMPSMQESDLMELLVQRMKRFTTRDALALFEGFLLPAVAETVLRATGVSLHEPLTMDLAAQVAHTLKAFSVEVEGLAELRSAQVQRGGCAVDAFNPATLEAYKVPGFYGTGEALDVDAPCGGYNLHWAWTSGLLAGYHAAQRVISGARQYQHSASFEQVAGQPPNAPSCEEAVRPASPSEFS